MGTTATTPTLALVMAAATAVGPFLAVCQNPLSGRRVAFTTPLTYAVRLSRILELRGAVPLHLPTVIVNTTCRTIASLSIYLSDGALDSFSALAFTSRTGIAAFSLALADRDCFMPLSYEGEAFTIAALGKDAELLHEEGLLSRLCRNSSRIRVLVPEIASPEGLVKALGVGSGRRVLCPVPTVVDLEEPPVVPDFLRALEARGWVPERASAYETLWAGPLCAEGLLASEAEVDALIFTSTAEVEGLMKGLDALGWNWEKVRRRWPGMLICAHGPVTCKGAERLGVSVDVVSSKFSSFQGVIEVLETKLRTLTTTTFI